LSEHGVIMRISSCSRTGMQRLRSDATYWLMIWPLFFVSTWIHLECMQPTLSMQFQITLYHVVSR